MQRPRLTCCVSTACRAALLGLVAMVMTACTTQPQGIEEVAVGFRKGGPFLIDAGEYPLMYDSAIEVLREKRFDIARTDYRFGKVTTQPRSNAGLFEPWATDGETFSQMAQEAFNAQRRVVTVSLEPANAEAAASADGEAEAGDAVAAIDPNTYELRVEVIIEQHAHPGRRMSGSTNGRLVPSTLAAVPAQWQERGIHGDYWYPVGRDPRLEERLFRAIVARSMKKAMPVETPDEPDDIPIEFGANPLPEDDDTEAPTLEGLE